MVVAWNLSWRVKYNNNNNNNDPVDYRQSN